MVRTRAAVEADMNQARADQLYADIAGDDIAEQIAEHRLNELLAEYVTIPLPRTP